MVSTKATRTTFPPGAPPRRAIAGGRSRPGRPSGRREPERGRLTGAAATLACAPPPNCLRGNRVTRARREPASRCGPASPTRPPRPASNRSSTGIELGSRDGLIGAQTADVSRRTPPNSTTRSTPRRRTLRNTSDGTVYDRDLAAPPRVAQGRRDPQNFLLRASAALERAGRAIGLYRLMSSLAYLPSSPTLSTTAPCTPRCPRVPARLASRTRTTNWSRSTRCTGVSPASRGVACGIGPVAGRRVRSRGIGDQRHRPLPHGYAGLKAIDSSVAAVNQGGRRRDAPA